MTLLHVSIAVGTAAALLAVLLLLLRTEIRGRRLALALTRKWVATDSRTSALLVALLAAIAVYAFAFVPTGGPHDAQSTSIPAPAESANNVPAIGSDEDPELAALRAYAEKAGSGPQLAAETTPAPGPAELADVTTMIAKLVARLEKQPDDLKGWKMLGWSYMSTGRLEEATEAYEAALKLSPGDNEVNEALEAVKSAQAAPATTSSTSPPIPAASSPLEEMTAAAGQSGDQSKEMIRDMVDQLDKRLKTTPKDENGWVLLMRSRMILGELDAASAALTRAREAFDGDDGANARLTAAARVLGIEEN